MIKPIRQFLATSSRRPIWQPKLREDKNQPFWFAVYLIGGLLLLAIVLLSVTACTPITSPVIKPEFVSKEANTREIIYWDLNQVELYPSGDYDYWLLSSWYVEIDGFFVLQQGTARIIYNEEYDFENEKELPLK